MQRKTKLARERNQSRLERTDTATVIVKLWARIQEDRRTVTERSPPAPPPAFAVYADGQLSDPWEPVSGMAVHAPIPQAAPDSVGKRCATTMELSALSDLATHATDSDALDRGRRYWSLAAFDGKMLLCALKKFIESDYVNSCGTSMIDRDNMFAIG